MLSILSRWLIQFCLCLDLTSYIPEISSSFLITLLLILSSLVYPLTLLRKRISAASRQVMSRFVVTYVSRNSETWAGYALEGNTFSTYLLKQDVPHPSDLVFL